MTEDERRVALESGRTLVVTQITRAGNVEKRVRVVRHRNHGWIVEGSTMGPREGHGSVNVHQGLTVKPPSSKDKWSRHDAVYAAMRECLHCLPKGIV